MDNQIDTISYFGKSYQSKVIAALLSDVKFLNQTSPMIKDQYFESDSVRWIVSVIINHFNQYTTIPTMDVFRHNLNTLQTDILKHSITDELRNIYTKIGCTDMPFVKDKFVEFCKNQVLKTAILESTDLLKSGDYDKIKSKIDNAYQLGISTEIGHDYVKDVDLRLQNIVRDTIPTPWPVINDIMDGGLARKELGIIIAPPGIGKSWTIQHIGLHALKLGKTVVYYTLELDDSYVGLRYDTCLVGKTVKEIKSSDILKDLVRKEVATLKGKSIIKYYPTKTVNCRAFYGHLDQLRAQNIIPDLVLIDYGDLVKPVERSTGDTYTDLGNIFTDMRGMAGEQNIPIWVPTQAGRKSVEQEVIQGDKVSGSWEKIMIGDFIMSLARTIADKLANTGRWHIIKNRFGPDGMTLPSRIDWPKGILDIFDVNSRGAASVGTATQNGQQLVKKNLYKRYIEEMN